MGINFKVDPYVSHWRCTCAFAVNYACNRSAAVGMHNQSGLGFCIDHLDKIPSKWDERKDLISHTFIVNNQPPELVIALRILLKIMARNKCT